jgi:hypothetical protein
MTLGFSGLRVAGRSRLCARFFELRLTRLRRLLLALGEIRFVILHSAFSSAGVIIRQRMGNILSQQLESRRGASRYRCRTAARRIPPPSESRQLQHVGVAEITIGVTHDQRRG